MTALELFGLSVLAVALIGGVLRGLLWVLDGILDGRRNYQRWVQRCQP